MHMVTLRASLGLALVAALTAVVACQVSVVNEGDASANSDAGASDASPEDAGGCVTETLPGDRACVPGTARAGAPITLALSGDLCGGLPNQPCEVTVSGSRITVAMRVRHCPPPDASPVCIQTAGSCSIPALAAGTYTVEVMGEPRASRPPRTLVVEAEATATSCSLPQWAPAPLDGSRYDTTCTQDTDCTPVTVGDLCAPCTCPGAAIAAKAFASYAADYRARLSECPVEATGGPVCAACPAPQVTCKRAEGAVTGTCAILPR